MSDRSSVSDAAGYGNSTSSKPIPRDSFLYLRRVDSNPYNLAVTTHSSINPNDYYTVSRLGITHFAQDSFDFQPLKSFERENYIYSLLIKVRAFSCVYMYVNRMWLLTGCVWLVDDQKLPFFKKYRLWKRFTLWKRIVNARKRGDALVSLNGNLFMLLPHFHDALLQLRGACLELQQVNLFDFEHPIGLAEAANWAADASASNTHHVQKTHTLSEFSMRLKAQKIRTERLVDHFISSAEMIAKHACEEHLYAFLQSTGFNAGQSSGGTGNGERKLSLTSTRRKESRVSKGDEGGLEPEKAMTYTERATMRTQCRRITEFLRVVEFLVSDALLRMVISSAVRLKDALARFTSELGDENPLLEDKTNAEEHKVGGAELTTLDQPKKQPLFRIDVTLRNPSPPLIGQLGVSERPRIARSNTGFLSAVLAKTESKHHLTGNRERDGSSMSGGPTDLLVFAPNTEALRSQVETLVFNGLTAVTNRDRLLRNAMFKVYVESSLDDGWRGEDGDEDGAEVSSEGMDLDILIMEDAAFVDTLQSIHSIILDGYERAEENCSELSVFLERYLENTRFCKQIADPGYYLKVDVHDFREYLDKYSKEVQDVDVVAETASCGLLMLDRVKLNALLKPSPRKCLDTLHTLIPVVFRHHNGRLMEDLTVQNDKISTIPTSVDEFSASLTFLRELQAGQDAVDDQYGFVRSLYHMLEEYKVRITDTDQMNAFLLTQKKTQLKASMELFEGSCEQYTAKFGVELEARLPGLVLDLENVSKALSSPILFDLKSNINDTIIYLTRVETQLVQLEKAVKLHFLHERTLGLPLNTALDELEDVKGALALEMDMWKTLRDWKGVVSEWEKLEFPKEVEIPVIVERIERFYSQILKWEQQLSMGMESLCTHLKASVEEYRLTMPILTDLRCTSFEERHLSEVHELLGFSIWQLDRSNAFGKAGQGGNAITLGELVRMHLSPFGKQINRIATEATQERLLKEMLNKIVVLWEHLEFEIKPYKETKECYVLGSLESIYATLEESLVSMTAVLNSKFLAPIKDSALIWQKRLLVFQETLDAWIECQRKWMHLETIFSAPDIQKQLPDEGTLFLGVNQFWKDLMRRTRDQPGCLKVSGAILIGASSNSKTFKDGGAHSGGGVGQALLDMLTKHNSSLERIEKSLEDYLETKRRSFPRFYFISSDELLEILAHAKEPQVVQRHLPKCFDALVKLDINDDGAHGGPAREPTGSNSAPASTSSTSQDIVAMISPEGERVAFGRTLKARGNVEDWLNALLTNMKAALHRHVKSCLLDYQHASRETWLFRHPAQAVALVSYIIWAKECEICFRSSSQDPTRELALWHQTMCSQLSNLTRLVRTSLTPIQRRVVVSLVTTDVHLRDVVESLVAKKVTNTSDFVWQQQLRYQWYAEHDECEVQQANCRIKYGYEYMGACSRLVITPLTDRCWMTITGALELRFGAAPSGPAGTGKTETSKDLAKALGIFCIVINCSDQTDYKMMGKVFNGVVQAGSWVCLDEFNRIDIEVLSVVAQQMAALRNARLVNARTVLFDGQHVALRDHHIIITMNPGYAGRTELPDNLKKSFRPVAMMVPDYALIAEILLFAEGFQLANPLSRKVTKLYKLCSEQLSQQTHYDFGMRAVKAVLTMAGALKRSTVTTAAPISPPTGAVGAGLASDSAASSHQDENVVLIKAMVGANFPKLTDEDVQLFKGIVKDLFPDTMTALGAREADLLLQGGGASSSTSTTWLDALEEEVAEQLRRQGLQAPRQWTTKILQLFMTLDVRIGVVQTGASGSGKSTAMKILKEAVTALRERKAHPDPRFQRVVSFTLNPKAISMVELYGFFHPVTREWTDGLASKLLRTCIMEKNEEMLAQSALKRGVGDVGPLIMNVPFYWIVFDGPIDPLWIESMNTVLDDNMTLCLANGERIKLLPKIQLLFEVGDTAAASPATISRLGVVYYHPDYLGWQPIVETWVSTLTVPVPANGLPSSTMEASKVVEPLLPMPICAKAKARILKYFDLFVGPGLAFLHSTAPSTGAAQRIPIATCDLAFVTTICHIFQSLLAHRAPFELFVMTPTTIRSSNSGCEAVGSLSLDDQRNRCMDLMFLFSFAWSFGGNLNLDHLKQEFEAFLYKLISVHEHFLSDDVLAINGKIPTPTGLSQATGDIQDFFIDFRYLSFSPWVSGPPEQSQQPSRSVAGRLLVPTLGVLKYQYMVELLAIDARQPILLTGATGSGKSALMQYLLDFHARITAEVDASNLVTDSLLSVVTHGKILPLTLNFSAQTSSAGAQLSIESKFTKKRRTLLGAPVNKQLVIVFVDDVNLPSVEGHGAQPTIELLRQFLEFRGFYDREKFFWKEVADSVLVAVGGLPGGGRHTLCPRFVRQFAAVFCLPSCDESAMRTIFHAILSSHIAGCKERGVFAKNVKDAILQTADATCELYEAVVQGLLPTPSKCHYMFNLRDVTKLMQGIVLGTQGFGVVANSSTKGSTQSTSTLTVEMVVNLWAHEGIRVFRDRLTDNADRKWLSEQLVATANRVFGVSWTLESVFEVERNGGRRRTTISGGNGAVSKSPNGLLLFSPRRPEPTMPTATHGAIKYAQVGDLERYEAFLNLQMAEYNAQYSAAASSCRPPLELVLFKDALVHTAAISRILIQPRGHALLLGMGGCGKRSLTRLAAFMTDYRCFEIELKKTYGLVDFREDLKVMMKLAALGESPSSARRVGGSALGATPTVFLLNDSQLVSDVFLEDVNTILNGADIPKLFTSEEMEKIISDVKSLLGRIASSSEQLETTSEASEFSRRDCEDYFHLQVQNCLHIVLCMNPVGELFRARLRQFPSLITCTTIDCFDEWPRTALQHVAEHFLAQEEEEEAANAANSTGNSVRRPNNPTILRSALAGLCAEVHQSIGLQLPLFFAECRRQVSITSQQYLDLIALFRRIHREKKAKWETKSQRLKTGVVKLEETNALVNTLQDELVALQPVLVSKAKEAEELLSQVAIDQVEAGKVAQRVAMDEAQVKQQQQAVAVCQADAQRDLDQALPALNAAVAALDALDKKDITEVKGFVKPPQAVQVVMEAVCIMLGEKPDWDNSKRVLSRSSFMAELKEYDKDNISTATLKKIRRYIESPEFAVDEVKKVSRAAMSLCMWVHAIDTYAHTLREVGPKRQRLAEMNAGLEEANSKLAAKQKELSKVLEKARKLKEQCDATLADKQRLVAESELTQERLQRAEKLTVGLKDERVRWKNSIEVLKRDSYTMLGDAFLAAACISYLGPFDGLFRGRILQRWTEAVSAVVDVSLPFRLAEAYGDVGELDKWQLLGLPSDNFSADNAICVMKGRQRWPLLIDPQQQASRWIKRLEARRHLEIVKSDDKALLKTVEECLMDGKPLLIEDVIEVLDASLESVLELKTSPNELLALKRARKTRVRLGDRHVEADMQHFRLYLTTKLANPNFEPDVFIRVNVINFTVTSDGLEEQLLSDVVQKERMEVEERKRTLLVSINQDQKLLQEIEIKILNLLSEAKGNILDDLELIQVLETSKQTSSVVARRLAESEATKLEVLQIRNQYQSVAVRGALLFFIIADLVEIDPMYQYSLQYFTRLFNVSLQEAPAAKKLSDRLESLQHHLTLTVYRNICRGLFQKHQQLFAFIICLRIMVKAGELSQLEIRLLDQSMVRFDGRITAANSEEGGDDKSKDVRNGVVAADDVLLALAQKLPVFDALLKSYYLESSAWADWIASDNPFLARLPKDFEIAFPRFLRLVLVRWLREEVFTTAIKSFIVQSLGLDFVAENGGLGMGDIFRDLDKSTPCLFILSSGADPLSSLERFAREKAVDEERYHVISLGQGQGPIAEAKMQECILQGHWLVLQNVHLVKSWLPKLQSLLTSLKEGDEVHEDFRLFLATFPVTYFPVSILQNSVKVTMEPPKGVKAILQRSMTLMKQLDGTPEPVESQTKESTWGANLKRRLAFGLSFFHAVLQERSKFGTLGWNLTYDFSDADFVSVLTLQRRLLDTATFISSNEELNVPTEDTDEKNKGVIDNMRNQKGSGWPKGKESQPAVPWDALLFLTGEIYYGGRVTDECDRRCLMAILRRFCSEPCFTSKPRPLHRINSIVRGTLSVRKSSSDLLSGVFSPYGDSFNVPEFQDEEHMVRFVDAMPELDGPQVFGMHSNAHIFHQQQQSQRLVELVMQLEPWQAQSADTTASTATSTAAETRSQQPEEIVLEMSREIQTRLPTPVELEKAESYLLKRKRDNLQDPLTIVLHQELPACHKLLRQVNVNLEELQLAIRGVAVMSVELEQMLHSLTLRQVPLAWKASDGSTSTMQSLSQWVSHLLFRCAFFHRWAARGSAPCNTFPLSVFSFPQGLLTAILQRHARKRSTPIHFLDFHFRVIDDIEFAAIVAADAAVEEQRQQGNDTGEEVGDTPDGAYLTGLVLEGGRWNSELKCLCDSQPGVMRKMMPVIRVLPQCNASPATAQVAIPKAPPPVGSTPSIAPLGSGKAARIPSVRTIDARDETTFRSRKSFQQASFHTKIKRLEELATDESEAQRDAQAQGIGATATRHDISAFASYLSPIITSGVILSDACRHYPAQALTSDMKEEG
ncbi:hypothetical protein BBJ28_00011412 [Nothophytophthora sp. Chile5]|nr:hypothetical protein BBJ28_00011412 [Nothophytophthora sp. Chile5]